MFEKYILKHYPSKSEVQEIKSVVSEIKKKLPKLRKQLFLGGSIAKSTFIKGKHDIDFFVKFETEADMKKLYPILKSEFKGIKKIKGSREYYQMKFRKYEIEFVPILNIKKPDKARNSTDYSIFHVEYINDTLSPKQKKDVVLLKQFCKSAGVYGAETHTMGFSGYALELLVAYYGSFIRVLENFSNAKPPLIIKFTKTEPENISILTLVDPAQTSRNVGAALSGKNFSTFQMKARQFLRDNDLKRDLSAYFKSQKNPLSQIKKFSRARGTKLITQKIKLSEDRKKNLGILHKKLRQIASRIKSEGITLYDYGMIEDSKHAILYYEFETLKVSKFKTHYGPPVHIDKKYFDEFVKLWEKKKTPIYVHNNRLCVDVPRKYKDVDGLLKKLFREYFL